MKRVLLRIIILILVFLLLTISNPSKEDFINWAANKIQQDSNSEIEKLLGGALAKPVFSLATTRQDYFLLSIFHLELNDKNAIYIGILKNFVRVK